VKSTATFFCFFFICNCLVAQKVITVKSPNGKIVFSFSLSNNKPQYSVSYNNQILIQQSFLSLEFDDGNPFENCSFTKPVQFSSAIESYKLVVGKASSVKHPYKKATIFLTGNGYNVDIEVRAFNEGVAFRYVFPKQKTKTKFTLPDEQTQFNLTGNPVTKALLLPNFTTSHEGLYTTSPLSEIKNDTLMDMPALFQFPGKIYMAITEAALLNYAGMYIIKRNEVLTSKLSPSNTPLGLPDVQAGDRGIFPHHSPWRVMLISNRIGDLIESNILTSLCPPLAINDISWLQPGTTTFPWWNGTIVPDSVKGGNNFETNKYYIDFCAANHIKYHTVVEYGGHEWYTNDGQWYQPGKNFDITKPVDGLDMKQICDYAKSKGVAVRVWTHWKALYPKLDTAFALFEQWGISGMMVDFMDRDDREMVNIQTEILEKAAKHHLHIQFHGAYKPTGLHRTYPNELTREGVMNEEYSKWDKFITPDHDLNVAFTRAIAGSTDYHLGGFRAMPVDKFIIQDKKPYVMGTRCHMLALYVVFENYLPMIADNPDAYINEPGFDVLQQIPGTWDETKVLAAAPDKFISIARRKGDNWYIGSITNNEARQLSISLSFLPEGKYAATIYSDGPDADENANQLVKEKIIVNKKTIVTISFAKGGGHFMILKKVKK
jgi:alpha-glucosidase